MKKIKFLLALFMLAGCSTGGSASVNVKDAVEAAKGTIAEENQVMMMEMDKTTIATYFGLDEGLIEDAFGYGPMMSAHIDMIVAIQAKEGKVDEIENAIETQQEAWASDAMMYPMNLAAVASAEVFSEGNNVYFVRLNTYTMEDITDEKKAELIEGLNQKAEDAIEALHK